jgi:putative NADH-flavin reductase
VRILFLTTAHNSLSQRLLIELTDRGHEVRVCVVRDHRPRTNRGHAVDTCAP